MKSMHRRDVLRLLGLSTLAGATGCVGASTPAISSSTRAAARWLDHEDMEMMRNFQVT